MVAMIEPPASGTLTIDGIDVTKADRNQRARLRTEVQIVFQDPYGSLNPRQKIGATLEEPLKINRRGTERRRLSPAGTQHARARRTKAGAL